MNTKHWLVTLALGLVLLLSGAWVSVTAQPCPAPLASVTIAGPVTGTIGAVYTFTATVAPPTATMPITYTWQPPPAGGVGLAVVTYTWAVTGAQTITVTAANCGNTVSNTHTITLTVGLWEVYLPLVLRNWPPPTWHSQCADCPPYFRDLTYHSQVLDSAGHPHIAFGGDHLYNAWRDGTGWHIEVADASGGVGEHASIALDSAGRPHIAYHDRITDSLKYARWDGTAWVVTTVDDNGTGVGWNTSIALDQNDRPHINYVEYLWVQEANLRYAHWDGSAWQIETVEQGVDSQGHAVQAGRPNSLALDDAGRPHIAYRVSGWGADPDRLKHAYWDGAQWQKETVFTADYLGASSLTLDHADRPHIGYYADGALGVADWTGTQWQIQTVVAGTYDLRGPCLALDSADRPHLSYYDKPAEGSGKEVRYARWDGSAWQFETLESGLAGVDIYDQTSLALDGSGRPHVLYEVSKDLLIRYAHQNASAQTPGAAWQVETVVQGGEVGLYTSLKLDSAGRPHVAYYDRTRYDLKYAWWDGAAWRIQIVARGNHYEDIGMPSLALAAGSDYPRIAYQGLTGLEYTAWNGSAWQTVTVDPAVDDGRGGTSLALDGAGRAHISYYTRYNHRYARWDGSAWQITIVDQGGNFEPVPTSLALDGLGRPHFSYLDSANWKLKHAWWDGSAWYTETVDSSGNTGYYSSLVLDQAGRPHIAYRDSTNSDLKYARWDGSAWQLETVDSAGAVGFYPSLALDSEGRPHISYHDSSNHTLKIAGWDGTQWQIQTLEGGDVGWFTSLALDRNDWPHITHYDGLLKDLRYTWFGP